MDIFDYRNTQLRNNKMFLIVDGVPHQTEFPYSNYEDLEKEVRNLKAEKIGTDDDLDNIFERKAITFPFSLTFDYFVFCHKKIPTYKELINEYIKLTMIVNPDGTLTPQKWLGMNFTITYNALSVRIYKVYYSFVREYAAFLYLRDKFIDMENVTVFINRVDDYKGRIDIGIKYNNTLYIIDTSLKSRRSDTFEKRKIDGTRRNISKADSDLMNKYHCTDYCRILAKANTYRDGNTYMCGQAFLYQKQFLDNIVEFIKNNKNLNQDYNASNLILEENS